MGAQTKGIEQPVITDGLNIMVASAQEILDFWFSEIDESLWFKQDDELDKLITIRFGDTHRRAAACELFAWRNSAQGRLAEIIILDQFSRNLFRESGRAFEFDSLALLLAQEAVNQGLDKLVTLKWRSFFYLPYMHSESAIIHQQAVKLFSQPGLEHNYKFELRHKRVIDAFGRYPHRNALLGRTTTKEEREFLTTHPSGF